MIHGSLWAVDFTFHEKGTAAHFVWPPRQPVGSLERFAFA
jgi:hypothetical protein